MKILNKLLDIIYPPTCGICGKLNKNYLCPKCEKTLYSQATFGQDIYRDKYFMTHYYMFKYENNIRNLMLNYKFNEKPYLYKTFSTFLNKYQKRLLQFKFYDIILAVPISKKRLKARGYNQSLLIAREMAKDLKLKLYTNVLIKEKNNTQQSTLNKERKRTKCTRSL